MYVESYQWQIGLERILILPLAPCGFDTPYLSLPPLGIAMMIPCTWGLSSSFLAPLPGSNSVGLIFSCVLVCFLPFCFYLVVDETYKKINRMKIQKKITCLSCLKSFSKEEVRVDLEHLCSCSRKQCRIFHGSFSVNNYPLVYIHCIIKIMCQALVLG